MSIYTLNWESVMNLNNRMLNIDKKTIKKNKKQIKNHFFHKKTFFIEIKNQKIKNGFLYNTTRIVIFFLHKFFSALQHLKHCYHIIGTQHSVSHFSASNDI